MRPSQRAFLEKNISVDQMRSVFEEVNELDLFEQKIKHDQRIPKSKAKRIICSIGESLVKTDEISWESANLIKKIYGKLPKPLNSYTKKILIPPQNKLWEVLPVNPTWVFKPVKGRASYAYRTFKTTPLFTKKNRWELIESHWVRFKKMPNVILFPYRTFDKIDIYEKTASLRLFSGEGEIEDVLISFYRDYMKKFPNPESMIQRISQMNLLSRQVKHYKYRYRTVFEKRRNKKGQVIWHPVDAALIELRDDIWRFFSFYLCNNDSDHNIKGVFKVVEGFSGAVLLTGPKRVDLLRDFQLFVDTLEKTQLVSQINEEIKKDGASPFYPAISEWKPIYRIFRGYKNCGQHWAQKRKRTYGKS